MSDQFNCRATYYPIGGPDLSFRSVALGDSPAILLEVGGDGVEVYVSGALGSDWVPPTAHMLRTVAAAIELAAAGHDVTAVPDDFDLPTFGQEPDPTEN